MKKLTNEELMNVEGGAGLTATLLNSISRTISTLVEVGRNLGSAIRRAVSGNVCPL